MKAPLTLITASYATLFLSGFFDWYLDDGFVILLSFGMLAGIVWAWIAVSKQ